MSIYYYTKKYKLLLVHASVKQIIALESVEGASTVTSMYDAVLVKLTSGAWQISLKHQSKASALFRGPVLRGGV